METNIYKIRYPHFAERLKERYNIEITFNEYMELCKINKLKNERPSYSPYRSQCKTGSIMICGVMVKVAKASRGLKELVTVLQNDNK
jgi:hypothetical protein